MPSDPPASAPRKPLHWDPDGPAHPLRLSTFPVPGQTDAQPRRELLRLGAAAAGDDVLEQLATLLGHDDPVYVSVLHKAEIERLTAERDEARHLVFRLLAGQALPEADYPWLDEQA